MENIISEGGRGYGKSAADYSAMIESGNYPPIVKSFQQHELNQLWSAGNRMAAVKKLQDILEPKRPGKTLL